MPHARWAPAPGISSTPLPPRLAGDWGPVSSELDGASTITAAGHTYAVPEFADSKIVTGPRGLVIVHVKVGRRVYVLANGLQLIETEDEAKRRALPAHWASIRS